VHQVHTHHDMIIFMVENTYKKTVNKNTILTKIALITTQCRTY